MKISVIIPPWNYYKDPFKLHPVNELYLATCIDETLAYSTVDVLDSRKNGIVKEDSDVYIYWISRVSDFSDILSIISTTKTKNNDSVHIVCGVYSNLFLDVAENIDSIIVGPPEDLVILAIEDLQKTGKIKPLYEGSWNKSDYKKYSFPKRHYLAEAKITNTKVFEKYGGVKGTSVMFSRGCPFNCYYCSYNIPNTLQRRSNAQIRDEISYLKENYNVAGINLRDEMCIPSWAKDVYEYMSIFKDLDVIWRGQTRANLNKDILKFAGDTGCVELSLGIESACQNVLDIVNKKQDLENIKNVIAMSHDAGIKIKMCLILGLPGEPQNILDMTKNYIEEANPDYVNVSGFCPIPGSEIFKNYQDYGIKYIDNNWKKHAHLMCRFDKEESFGLPFEYEEDNRWGKTFSRNEIEANIVDLQEYLRNRKLVY